TIVLTEVELKDREAERIATEESLAQVLLFTKRFEEAEPLLRNQLARDSANIQVKSDLAAAIAGQNRNDEAATLYGELLSRTDLDSQQLFNLGYAIYRARD